MADPLDQDQTVATAWQQAGWADYSGVGRTLQALTQAEAEAIGQVLREISQPMIDEQVTQALATQGRLIYDGDLTGRPVSSTSTTYPEAAFGHMDDEVRLGYQAAVVSVAQSRPMAGTGSPSSRIRATWCRVCWPKNWSWPPKPARACGLGGGPICSANAGRPCALSAAKLNSGWRNARRVWPPRKLSCRCAQNAGRRLKRRWRPWSPTTRTGSDRSARTVSWPRLGSRSQTRQRQHARQAQVVAHSRQAGRAPDQDALALVQAQEAGFDSACSVSSTRMPPIRRPCRRFSPGCRFRDRRQRRPADRNGLRSLHPAA